MEKKNISYDFEYEINTIPKSVTIENKKGALASVALTPEIFEDKINLGLFQRTWVGSHKLEVIAFDKHKRTANIKVHFEYLSADGVVYYEAYGEMLKQLILLYLEFPGKYDNKTDKNTNSLNVVLISTEPQQEEVLLEKPAAISSDNWLSSVRNFFASFIKNWREKHV